MSAQASGTANAALTAHATLVLGTNGGLEGFALAESFVASIKRELVDRFSWPTRQSVWSAIFEYIEVFYNRKRLHSALGYRSPADYEEVTLREGVAA